MRRACCRRSRPSGAEVGVCISDAGVQVCATELYGDISLAREEVTGRLVEGLDGVTVVGLRDYSTPYASGSARVDGYVVCPCSMSTAASIAAGAMANLVHRAASVALEGGAEARARPPRDAALDDPPGEPPALRRAGATVVMAAPGFYHAPQDHRRSGQLRRGAMSRSAGNRPDARQPVGAVSSGTLAPAAVEAMFDRISPVYDTMNRLMTAGSTGRWRRLTVRAVVRPGDRVLDACCGTGDLALEAQRAGGSVTGVDFSERMLERARRKSGAIEWVRGDVLALPFPDGSFDSVTVGFGIRNVAELPGPGRARARAPPRRAARLPRDHAARAGLLRPSSPSGSTGSCRWPGSCSRAARPTPTCRRACAASRARGPRRGDARAGFTGSAGVSSAAGSWRCTRRRGAAE